jgi:hypothetical protein
LGQRLEFNGGLAFVVDPVPHPEQRGNGVEQPAHARTRHTSGSALQLRAGEPQFVGRCRGDGCQIRGPVDIGHPQLRQRHPPRITHRGVTTGERHRQQVAGAHETVAVGTERENLAAPNGLVAAVAGAIEGDSDDGFADPPVFGQQ